MERHYLSMGWRDALFAHWPVDAAVVDDRLPPGLTARRHDGSAWLGIVAFVMEDIRPRGVPTQVGFTFGEANLRTYVEGPDGEEGIYFYNLDADDTLSVGIARQFYQLPYYGAHMEIDRGGALPDETGPHERTVGFVTHRTHPGVPAAHLDATFGPTGDRFVPENGTLEQFLVENYRFYLAEGDVGPTGTLSAGRDADPTGTLSAGRDADPTGTLSAGRDAGDGDEAAHEGSGDLFYGDVAHPPWDLYEADLDLCSTNFFEANGFERPDTEPLAHYSPGVPVRADRIRTLD